MNRHRAHSSLSAFLACVLASLALIIANPLRAQTPGSCIWSNWLGGTAFEGSAAIGADGTIYVTSANTRLDALDPSSGKVKWSFKTTSDIKSSPAVGADGTIYFGGRDRKFYAVTQQGKLKWSFPVEAWIDSSPAIGADGSVYFGCWDGEFYALDSAGKKKWASDTGAPIDASPVIDADGNLYIGSHDKKFHSFTPEGTNRWAIETGGPIVSSPAIAGDGTVYFTSTDGFLYAVSESGEIKWKLRTGGFLAPSPVIGSGGMIYLGVTNLMSKITPDGKKDSWDMTLELIDGSAAISADGNAVFGSRCCALACFSAKGDQLWSFVFNAGIRGSPVIGPDGTIYFGGGGGYFYALKGTHGPAATSWPLFRGNLRQTGCVPPRK